MTLSTFNGTTNPTYKLCRDIHTTLKASIQYSRLFQSLIHYQIFQTFKILSYFKFLRGTKFDVFGYTTERKKERALVQKTINTIHKISEIVDINNHKKIIDFLEIPLSIKGYGHVKEKNMKMTKHNPTGAVKSINV